MKTERKHSNDGLWSLVMVIVIFCIIQFDAVTFIILNQIIAMGITPIIWGIGVVAIWITIKRKNTDTSFYNSLPFSGRDALILFFVTACGVTMAISNYIYAGLMPLFIRELFTGYLLYTIRNILYYPLEVLLMLALLICAQKAGELLTKKTLPWGAFALFLLRGLPHVLWHGVSDGIVSALRAFPYSIPFYVSNKNCKTSYISMLILWFL